ncbi:MAG: hypothetical protein ISS77_07210 [Phycisphaerae bacterium]|nr:hypothetical protein [Phycisphaerae bacterium]
MNILDRIERIKKTLKYLAAFGNENILWGHIKALEEDVLNSEEDRKNDITNTPHFSAWIRLCCEYFSNSLFHSYYKMHLNEEIYNYSFNKIIEKITTEHEKSPSYLKKRNIALNDIIDSVYLIVGLRHCFQHGGLPNLITKLRNEKLEKRTTPEEINNLLNPSNFKKTREIFQKALLFTLTLPKKSIG